MWSEWQHNKTVYLLGNKVNVIKDAEAKEYRFSNSVHYSFYIIPSEETLGLPLI